MLAGSGKQATQTLHREIVGADDEKIGKIIAYVDQVGDAGVNRALLDPLRSRLALLRPVRPLRLSRLLFTPLDPLIVSPAVWRPTSLRVPRTALEPLTAAVTAQFGPDLAFINTVIEGKTTASLHAIASAGASLWPRAAEILAQAGAPPEWEQTGLPKAVFAPLARSVAAVLRRAVHLQQLARQAQIGPGNRDGEVVGQIMAGLANEPPDAAAMVAQLVLIEAPHAAIHLRRFVSGARDNAESIALNRAMGLGIDQCLTYLEREANFVRKIGAGSIRDAVEQVRFVAKLLHALEGDPAAAVHRSRVRSLRGQLDKASRLCFANGIREEVAAPLAAMTEATSAVEQRRIEASARELRSLENTARHFSDAASYDQHLDRMSEAVCSAFAAGAISLARACRLIEILSGPEAAIALHTSASARPA